MTYVTLIGAEDVVRAGHTMRAAAEQMQRAASQIDEATRNHAQRMEELLYRYEEAVELSRAPEEAAGPGHPELHCYTCGVDVASYYSIGQEDGPRRVKVCGPCKAKLDAGEIQLRPIEQRLGHPGGPQCSRCEPDQAGGYTCIQATCPSNRAAS